MKGFTNEQPKIVAACVGVSTRAWAKVQQAITNYYHTKSY